MLTSRKSVAEQLSNRQHEVCHNMRGLFMLVKQIFPVQQVQWLAAHMTVIILCMIDFTCASWTAIHFASSTIRATKKRLSNYPGDPTGKPSRNTGHPTGGRSLIT